MMRGMRILLLVIAALLLAACGSSRVIREGGARPTPRVSAPKYGASTIVKRGDTLYRIAINNGISPLDLAMWNDVPPPYVIHPGQRLRLYPGGARRASTAATSPRVPPRTPSRVDTTSVRSRLASATQMRR